MEGQKLSDCTSPVPKVHIMRNGSANNSSVVDVMDAVVRSRQQKRTMTSPVSNDLSYDFTMTGSGELHHVPPATPSSICNSDNSYIINSNLSNGNGSVKSGKPSNYFKLKTFKSKKVEDQPKAKSDIIVTAPSSSNDSLVTVGGAVACAAITAAAVPIVSTNRKSEGPKVNKTTTFNHAKPTIKTATEKISILKETNKGKKNPFISLYHAMLHYYH